jgi:hypothetical protein
MVTMAPNANVYSPTELRSESVYTVAATINGPKYELKLHAFSFAKLSIVKLHQNHFMLSRVA